MLLAYILAPLPFVFFILMLIWKKTSLVWVSLATMILVVILAAVFWKIVPVYLAGSLIKGFLVALDIFFIVFGAILFLELTKVTDVLGNVCIYLERVSKDLRIQVIFLAWFFENFLEGTAGFGTPSTVVAPLLIGLGISPINAVIIALLGNSASVVFGAAGTPIKVGLGGIAGAGVAMKAALINSVGILVPVFMLWFLTSKRENGRRLFFEALPFAVWSGIAFAVPSILTVFVGQEFPSILGSVLGLILVLVTTKLGILVPKNMLSSHSPFATKGEMSLKKVIFPYAFLIALLVAGKFLIGNAGIILPLLVKHTFAFFNPGFAFFVAVAASAIVFKVKTQTIISITKLAFVRSLEPFFVIVFMSGTTQVMVNSFQNSSGLPSMVNFVAIHAKNFLLPLWAPMVGALGSFLTGSATVSNLMFGNFLALSAKDLMLNTDTILALAVVGGAAGNMIALADILAAEAVAGLRHEEKKIIAGVAIPCLIYLVLVGIAGILIV